MSTGGEDRARTMSDMFDKETRRRIMRAVRTTATEPEERLAVALRALGLRFRRNDARVFGRPDIVFPKARLAVFVDGDFWHGRAWFEDGAAPSTNVDFWIGKFERNRRRDRTVERELRRRGWSVLRLWSSDVRRDTFASARRVRVRLRRLTGSKRLTSVRDRPSSRRRRTGSDA
jgi:DNA mismatch endonuclease (patch repair protein)